LDIDINSDDLTLEVTVYGELPEVKTDEKVNTDYFGEKTENLRTPGPINNLVSGTKLRFNIDPRKIQE
jgi:hypothetical protein